MIWFGVDTKTRPVIIAEIGINHNGDMSLAKEMISAAKENGADAVKFQTITPEYLFDERTLESVSVPWKEEEITLAELFEKVSFSDDEFIELKEYADEVGISMFSTPFSLHDLDRVDRLGFDVYKVASPDIVFVPLLEGMAKRGKPTILSVGTATLEEIDRAVSILNGKVSQLAVLYCVSLYPPKPKDMNLQSIQVLKSMYPYIDIGFSDHSLGIHMAIAAITMGAKIVEKHFTIDKNLPGPDQAVSITPDELKILSQAARELPVALSGSRWEDLPHSEKQVAQFARRGAVLARDKREGDIIDWDDVIFVRPQEGITPYEFKYFVGRRLKSAKSEGERIYKEDLE